MAVRETYELEPVSGGGWRIVSDDGATIARFDRADINAALARLDELNQDEQRATG